MVAGAHVPGVAEGREQGDFGLGGVGFLLGVAHRTHRRIWEKNLEEVGLTAPQAAVLRLIAEIPGDGIRELARRLGTDPMNVQRIVKTLVVGGLCEVRPDLKDARRHPLYLSSEGDRLAGVIAGKAQEQEEVLRESLGPARYQETLRCLKSVVEADENSARRTRPN